MRTIEPYAYACAATATTSSPAPKIDTLRIPPGNHLEKLKGNLKEYWSLRINLKWRIIFKWNDGQAFDVGIIDYH